jgi:hypothetical protein
MTDVTAPRFFIGISPCRIADTRAGQGFSGQAGPPGLASFSNRNFQISGTPTSIPAPPAGCPAGAIPNGADAVSVQFTVVFPTSSGNLVAWQAGGTQPVISVINWDAGTVALGSGTILPLSPSGAITVRLNTAAAGQGAELVIDVNGYFSDSLETPATYAELINNSGSYTARFQNLSTTCGGNCGFLQVVSSGNAITGNSTEANTDINYGVFGITASTGNGTASVEGEAYGPTGYTFGGKFFTISTAFNSAGVKGISGNGDPLAESFDCGTCHTAGVRGMDNNAIGGLGMGVLGISRGTAIAGILLDPSDVSGSIDSDAEGFLGHRVGPTSYGVFFNGGTGGTGIKSFVEPHATDPSKVIRYVSLEGPEAGTYFRGKGRFARGVAVIEVPENFRLVTAAEGLSIQVTPIGDMATVAVVSIGLDRIVVKASRNVEFFYTVNGVRNTFKDHNPVVDGVEFMPTGQCDDAPLPERGPEAALDPERDLQGRRHGQSGHRAPARLGPGLGRSGKEPGAATRVSRGTRPSRRPRRSPRPFFARDWGAAVEIRNRMRPFDS